MRLALLSDIHGNFAALQAVLSDLEAAGGADHIWFLGDVAAGGPDPAACVQALRDLPNLKGIQGNTDRYLATGARSADPTPTKETWPTILERERTRYRVFEWTMTRLDWPTVDYMLNLPTGQSLEIEGYGWMVGFHAVPGDDEKRITPETPEHEVLDALIDVEGRLAVYGHIHIPVDRQVGEWRLINPGSVGFPFDGDPRAAYAILTFDNGALSVDFRRVAYDIESVIERYTATNHPAPDSAIQCLRTGRTS